MFSSGEIKMRSMYALVPSFVVILVVVSVVSGVVKEAPKLSAVENGEGLKDSDHTKCDEDIEKANNAGALVTSAFVGDHKYACGAQEGCKKFHAVFESGKCDKCKPSCTKIFGSSQSTCICKGESEYCVGNADVDLFGTCQTNCYERVVGEANKEGQVKNDSFQNRLRDQIRNKRVDSQVCLLVPKEELDDCRAQTGFTKEAIKNLKEMQVEDFDKILKVFTQMTEPGSIPAKAETTIKEGSGVITSIVNVIGGVMGFVGECWTGVQAISMTETERNNIIDPNVLKDMAIVGYTGFTDDQMLIGGKSFGNSFIPDTLKLRLSESQSVNYRKGAILGKYNDLEIASFNQDAQSALRSFEHSTFPAQRASGGSPDPRASAGGMDLMQGVQGASQALQFLKQLQELFANKESGAKATDPGRIELASTKSPDVDKPSGNIVVTSAAGCGAFCKNQLLGNGNLECQQVSGGILKVSTAGTPGCTSDHVLVADPSQELTNPSTNSKNLDAGVAVKKSDDTASMLARLTLPPGSSAVIDGSSGLVGVGSEIPVNSLGVVDSGISKQGGAYVSGSGATVVALNGRRLTVDMSDEVVLFDHESLTVTRVPYDSVADEAPIYHFVTGELLMHGESYPLYRKRPKKVDREISTRLSFFNGENLFASLDENTYGKLSKDVVRIVPRKDSRIDLWGMHSYLSTAIEDGVIRGLSTMVDKENLAVVSILKYLMDGHGEYDYFVGDGLVVIKNERGRRRIVESSFGVPASTLLGVHRRLVYA